MNIDSLLNNGVYVTLAHKKAKIMISQKDTVIRN